MADPTTEEAPRYTEKELATQAKDLEIIGAQLDEAVSKIVSAATGADNVGAAVTAVVAGIVNEVRVLREDGPTIETFADKLEAASSNISAAVASRS